MESTVVGSATAAPNCVTKAEFSQRLMAALALVALLGAACASPAPPVPATAPASNSPTSAPSTTSNSTAASNSNSTSSSTATPEIAPATARTPAASAQPVIPLDLNADQAATFQHARLLQIEGDYTTAAQQWRSLLSATPEARYSLAL